MKLRNLITAAAIAALPLSAAAATFVIPAAGTGEGAFGSRWQSEVTLHTSGPRAVTVALSFHQNGDVKGPVEVTLGARETLSIADIAKTKFGLETANGAVVIEVADADARSLAVTSRTFNTSDTAEFGQDIPAVNITDAARPGDVIVLNAPSAAANNRFNFGIYAVSDVKVTWQLVRANGEVAKSVDRTYEAGTHAQYNNGIDSLLIAQQLDNDTIHARVTEGKAIFYGSAINRTGDPTFVPGVRTRDDINIQLAGIDLDENGTIDVLDADGDGMLDASIDVFAAMFPSYFRIVASGEFGEAVTLEIVSSTATADLLDANGTMRVIAFGELKGKSGEIVVRATSGTTTTLFTIPVRFR